MPYLQHNLSSKNLIRKYKNSLNSAGVQILELEVGKSATNSIMTKYKQLPDDVVRTKSP